ncbi:hypothetical protein VFPPC_14071 [Pochonia chlamydosporia 170]|uniref:DUF7136 domain-containing protein n=1 Tax=Pochonia chlamydosporia 170 TaxID=1380566 RepID=A0A179F5M6_METCM|nr:hypothetical protein VFPPC_14071 [Pochonia chlamydosporia 170]OAQ60419.1 hypothetical protein VFPPC_14071 [Pochonia chlamydosporia 170]
MPFVWAIQNAHLAATLDASIFTEMFNFDRKIGDDQKLALIPANLTGKDVYYAYTYSSIFNTEDSFWINWDLRAHNCSKVIYYENDDAAFGGQIVSSFTTKKGSQKADFAAAQHANCSNTRSARFNITGTQPKSHGEDSQGREIDPQYQCALLSPDTPFPKRSNPCAIKMESAVATSISSSLGAAYTKTKCGNPFVSPTFSCPAEKSGTTGRQGEQFPTKPAVLLATAVRWVAGVIAW